MSKKADKKQKAKVPQVDQDSPEWQDEVARKQAEAYDMIQRAIIRSQIELMLATRDDLVRQKADIEAKTEQQSQDQNDIYQYLRKKLKDNYASIAELETKVSQAHEDRLQKEKGLIAKTKGLDEKRKTEKARLLERLESLEVDLAALKDYLENFASHEQKLKDLKSKIDESKEAFRQEVATLNAQVEEEWDLRRREKEERIKITRKVAAKATQEQLGPRTKHMIGQNKKMMSELRFQCYEVEKMQNAHRGLIESNTLLLAQAASARHGVEMSARRSHLLQRIIRYMHRKLQTSRTEPRKAPSGWANGASHGTAGLSGQEWEGGLSGGAGAQYKLAGMSEEERQQMLDLREELRREEVDIAVTQGSLGVTRGAVRKEDEEKARVFTLRADLARVLAWCHEDPLLGTNDSSAGSTASGIGDCTGESTGAEAKTLQHSGPLTRITNLTVADRAQNAAPRSVAENIVQERHTMLPAIGRVSCPLPKQQPEHTNIIVPAAGDPGTPGHEPIVGIRYSHATFAGVANAEGQSRYFFKRPRQIVGSNSGGIIPHWPEYAPLPVATTVEAVVEEGGGQNWSGPAEQRGASRLLSGGVLDAVSRLFLAKLYVSVEITPTPLDPTDVMSLPSLASTTSAGKSSRKQTRMGRISSFVGPFDGGRDSDGRGFNGNSGATNGNHGGHPERRGEADDVLSTWSDRLTTGIPSWDLLETAVRQIKRRRTRDVACQTLSFRELRDRHSNSPSAVDCSAQKQEHLSYDNDCHCLLQWPDPTARSLSRGESTTMCVGPVSPIPTVSKQHAKINATSGKGGKLGVRAIKKGKVKQKQTPRGVRPGTTITSSIGSDGMETRNIRKDNHKSAPHSGAQSVARSHHQELDGIARRQPRPPGSAIPMGPSLCRPQPFQLRKTPPLGYVSVSWGDEIQDEARRQALPHLVNDIEISHKGGHMRHVDIITNVEHPNVDVRESTGGRVAAAGGGGGGIRGGIGGGGGGGGGGCRGKTEKMLGLDRTYNTAGSTCGGSIGGYAYEPLSKGSDYRKVLLFTVDDGDKHVVRRVHPKRTPVAVSGATLSALGVRNHDDPVESTALLSEQEAQNIYTDNINEASLVLCPAQISSIIP